MAAKNGSLAAREARHREKMIEVRVSVLHSRKRDGRG